MQPLPFRKARRTVLDTVQGASVLPATEIVPLDQCAGRVLAADVVADRPYPPLPRSIRDGFAVRAADFPGSVQIVGEVRAGEVFGRVLLRGEGVEIMTGAPVPEGADAVIMVEHATVSGSTMQFDRDVPAGQFVVPAGAERAAGGVAVPSGTRLSYRQMAAMATVGAGYVPVYRRPEVSILATGDELVEVESAPELWQIRNSNSHTIAEQTRRAGAIPRVMPVAADRYESTRELIETALTSDVLLLSGGVSAGKYDLVEQVLADLGAEFCFDRVLIQPGQPVVFGRVRDRFFFGLPGNPASTMVTFELFARAAIDLLSGCREAPLPFTFARLVQKFVHRPGLTRFLPARIESGEVEPVPWQGSGDVFALSESNAFLVAADDRESWEAGEFIEVLTV